MTDAQIIAEFLRIEAVAQKRPQGADHARIYRTLAQKSGRDLEDVQAVVIAGTISQPN